MKPEMKPEMSPEEQAALQVALVVKIMAQEHPPLPTDEMRERLKMVSLMHMIEHTEGEDPPTVETSVCVLISLLHEVLAYRDKYGLLELPDENWKFVERKK